VNDAMTRQEEAHLQQQLERNELQEARLEICKLNHDIQQL
jgi:hypothetical protein